MGVSLRQIDPLTSDFGCQIVMYVLEYGYGRNLETKLKGDSVEEIILR